MTSDTPLLSACPIGLEISGVALMRKSGLPAWLAYSELRWLVLLGLIEYRWVAGTYPTRRMYRRVARTSLNQAVTSILAEAMGAKNA